MKKLLLIMLLPFSVFAQQTVKSKAFLESVKVYNNGAELHHTGSLNLRSGISDVIISNVSGRLNANSIQVGLSAGATILSVQFNRDFLNSNDDNPTIKKLNDSVKVISNELIKTKNSKAVEEQTLVLLDENRKSGGTSTGTNVAELIKLAAYYRSKSAEVRETIAQLNLTEEKQNKKLTSLQNQINEIKNNPNQLGQLVLQVMTKSDIEANYDVSYVTPNAYWSASYDIKAKNTSSPLEIVYKGAIVQNTGLDWKKVKLSLSTGNPNYNITAPNLNPWFVSTNPIYSSLKYKTAGIQSEDKAELKEVVTIRGYNSLAKSAPQVSTVNNYTAVSESQLGVTFKIDIPYDIDSDNKPHTVSFKEYSIPAQYKYYAVPKLSNDAYLLANVTDWEKLNLQYGEANIIFEGTYTGKSLINPAILKDTLAMSMGKDKKIIISKEKQTDFSSTKFIGSNKKQVFSYLITIRNTKKEAIELSLKDQYPLSTESDVEIELLENSGAEVNKENGMLSWLLKIAPNETKTIKLSYSVKSPKAKIVAGL